MIKKYLFKRREFLLLGLILLIYFLLRLPNLTLQPIFADEAIYIRWSQVMKAEPTLRFLPLSDGKTPLFMWILMPLFKIFSDPLYAGRFLSVISGSFTLLGSYFLASFLFNRRVGLWAALLIATTPFILFLDRLALVDSMLSAVTVWTIFLAVLVVKYLRFDLAMILGYLLGLGLLTKTPGMFNLIMLPSTVVSFGIEKVFNRTSLDSKKIVKLFLLWGVALIIGLGFITYFV
jgi:4-amino-4-deoxy-L-arabinose transferase-like glycosyltransferase